MMSEALGLLHFIHCLNVSQMIMYFIFNHLKTNCSYVLKSWKQNIFTYEKIQLQIENLHIEIIVSFRFKSSSSYKITPIFCILWNYSTYRGRNCYFYIGECGRYIVVTFPSLEPSGLFICNVSLLTVEFFGRIQSHWIEQISVPLHAKTSSFCSSMVSTL